MYDIHSSILKVVQARMGDGSYELKEKSMAEVASKDNLWESTTGTPEVYILDYQSGKLRLYPIPQADDTLYLIVKRLPKQSLSSDTQSPEIREEYQRPMLHYAAYKAYLKDGPRTLDPERALMHIEIFDREFGSASAYSETRKRRKKPRGIKYGGL